MRALYSFALLLSVCVAVLWYIRTRDGHLVVYRVAKQAARSAPTNLGVAVVYCGYIGVAVPHGGRAAREYMIDVLKADVLVAGTYTAKDCVADGAVEVGLGETIARAGQWASCADRLWSRLDGLEPIAARSLELKWTREQLNASVGAAPAFARVAGAYSDRDTYHGLTIWSPVLGSPTGHMLHQLRDYARAHDLLVRRELQQGGRYARVVFSRLELEWLAPHPPLQLLPPELLWIPIGFPRMNDRHVVMARAHADVWFRRWQLVHSARLLDVLPLDSLVHDGPELVLENLVCGRDHAAGAECCRAGRSRPGRGGCEGPRGRGKDRGAWKDRGDGHPPLARRRADTHTAIPTTPRRS